MPSKKPQRDEREDEAQESDQIGGHPEGDEGLDHVFGKGGEDMSVCGYECVSVCYEGDGGKEERGKEEVGIDSPILTCT